MDAACPLPVLHLGRCLSYSGIGLIALGLIWIAGPMETERLYLAGLLGAAPYAAFFLAMLARPAYGGVLYDENGYLPFKAPLGAGSWDVDVHRLHGHDVIAGRRHAGDLSIKFFAIRSLA